MLFAFEGLYLAHDTLSQYDLCNGVLGSKFNIKNAIFGSSSRT